MTLTPEIVKSLARFPEEYQKTWCWEYLKAQADDVPSELASQQAHAAAYLALHGFRLDPAKARELDTFQWMRETVERIWACYLLELERHTKGPSHHDLTTIRQNAIRHSLAKWRAYKQRRGRSPEDCVKDQIRGAFYAAKQGAVKRLDPEGVLEYNKHTKANALAWCAHVTFEEE